MWIVPGSLGCGSSVLAAIVTLAPSRAARNAIASPMPRDPPEMKSVLPLSDMLASPVEFLVVAANAAVGKRPRGGVAKRVELP